MGLLDGIMSILFGNAEENKIESKVTRKDVYEKCTFDEKINKIMDENGGQINGYELKRNIALEEAEAICGREIYTRRVEKYYREPQDMSYAIYKDGTLKVYIRLWEAYTAYNCVVNREVLANCNKYGVKVIDFFDYMPNEYNYMKERIENYII